MNLDFSSESTPPQNALFRPLLQVLSSILYSNEMANPVVKKMCSCYICGFKMCALRFLHVFSQAFSYACMCKIMEQKSHIILCSNISFFFYFMHIYLYFPVIRHLASTWEHRSSHLAHLTALTAHNWSFLHWSPLQPYLPPSHLQKTMIILGLLKAVHFPLLIWIYLSKHAPPPSLEIISGGDWQIHEFSHPSDQSIYYYFLWDKLTAFHNLKVLQPR